MLRRYALSHTGEGGASDIPILFSVYNADSTINRTITPNIKLRLSVMA